MVIMVKYLSIPARPDAIMAAGGNAGMIATSRPTLTAAEAHPDLIRVRWRSGTVADFHSLWLRDSCQCSACVDPVSGQRVVDASALPDISSPAAIGVTEDLLTVTWREDGHVSRYASAWLLEEAARSLEIPSTDYRDARLPGALPEHEYEAVATGEKGLLAWLEDVDRLGFAILHGVPAEPGEVTRVTRLFGYVRETNYGELFDVRSVVNPTNLAYTSRALGPHTDNPYRDPAPTLQLLHCLSSSVEGGENTLVDGFRVAEGLRRRDAVAFELLTQHPIRYRYEDATAILESEVPVIALDPRGRLRAIYFNARSRQPTQLPDEIIGPFYAAYCSFASMLTDPGYVLRVRLEPGDLLIMDNRRILHGRTGFSAAGERHLQGCYADVDGLRSRLALLRRRRTTIDDIFACFRRRGDSAYLGEPVSMSEHMLQSALAAAEDGAAPALIAAALLHDFGHLTHDLPEDCAEQGIDSRHEDVGYAVLEAHFPPAVTEPIHLHVAAKRFLCAVDPPYRDALSPASQLSLELQGGPMTSGEVEQFERNLFYEDAVRLRRYDDQAKMPGVETPPLEHYRAVLESVLIR
jgi:gamma-butyrobetaine dioxygenase